MVCRHLILLPLKTNDGSKIQVRRRHILYGIPTQEYPPAHRLKYLTSYLDTTRINAYIVESRQDLIRASSSVSHARRLSYMRSHQRLMETHPSVTGIEHYGIMQNPTQCAHTCLSLLFSSETTLKSNHNFLTETYQIYILVSHHRKASSIISQLTAQDNSR